MHIGNAERAHLARALQFVERLRHLVRLEQRVGAVQQEQIEVVGGETVAKELTPANLVRTLEMNIKVTGGDKDDVVPAVLSGRLTGVSSRVLIHSGKPLFDTPAFMTFEPEEVSPGVYAS